MTRGGGRGLLGAVLALYVFGWGSAYVWTAIALRGFDPAGLVFARLLIAASALLAAVTLLGGAQHRRAVVAAIRRPREAMRLGLVAYGFPYLIVTLAQQRVPAGLTGVLIASMPLWTAALAPLLDRAELAAPRQIVALLVGLGGVALVVGVDVATSLGELLGAAAILVGAISFAAGGFLVNRDLADLPVLARSTVSLWLAALMLAPVGLMELIEARPGADAIGGLLAAALVSTALGASLQFWLTRRLGPARAALPAYVAPGVSLLLGALLLGESITASAVVGLVLIVGAVIAAGRRGPGALVGLDADPKPGSEIGVGGHCRRGGSSDTIAP